MIRPVAMKVVKDVIFGFSDIKAPGPDGFNSLFFKRAWNIIGEEILNAIIHFFATDLMKAYDTVEWSFVKELLKTMNLHPIFIGWVKMDRIDYARYVGMNVSDDFPDHTYKYLPSESGEYNGTSRIDIECEWRPQICKL
ncbi:hypothetical protein BUALT_Bualt04G0044500 [Buddleja alternifolia]|uniref:Reverse transcriptase domain-containing protein n=1 Tax=Buddleja alternifolia TaxID=168488 RepID=A0AAV6XUE2_9LAMI|nr:hypothetical protein BUALT_Bualt04G0044500 [Buddleja alternifolia]